MLARHCVVGWKRLRDARYNQTLQQTLDPAAVSAVAESSSASSAAELRRYTSGPPRRMAVVVLLLAAILAPSIAFSEDPDKSEDVRVFRKVNCKKGFEYPRDARRKGIEGYVGLKFSVSEEGIPFNIEITEHGPTKSMDEAALDAVSCWRYKAKGVVHHNVETRLTFELSDDV